MTVRPARPILQLTLASRLLRSPARRRLPLVAVQILSPEAYVFVGQAITTGVRRPHSPPAQYLTTGHCVQVYDHCSSSIKAKNRRRKHAAQRYHCQKRLPRRVATHEHTMHRVTSATSVLSLDDLEDDAAKAPRFTRRNYSPAAIIDGATLRHRRGAGAPALCEIVLGEARCELVGDPDACEIELVDVGFRLGVGAVRDRGICAALRGGGLPHCFEDGCLLNEGGSWVAAGKVLASTEEGYETFRDGDILRLTCDRKGAFAVERIRAKRVTFLGAISMPGAGRLRPFVLLKGLETACVRLVAPQKPWRLHDRRRTYPDEYEAAAALIDAACPALPGDALEVVMAYCRWSDFFAHD